MYEFDLEKQEFITYSIKGIKFASLICFTSYRNGVYIYFTDPNYIFRINTSAKIIETVSFID